MGAWWRSASIRRLNCQSNVVCFDGFAEASACHSDKDVQRGLIADPHQHQRIFQDTTCLGSVNRPGEHEALQLIDETMQQVLLKVRDCIEIHEPPDGGSVVWQKEALCYDAQ